MNQPTLAPHEALEIHEILRFKETEIKKLTTALPLVQDEELLAYMKDCLESSRSSVAELQRLSGRSTMAIGGA